MSPTQYWHGAKGWSDEEKLFYIGCKGTVQIYNQSIMPQPAKIYIASFAALHAATPTLPAKVRVFQTLDQVGRVPMYDALRTDRKIMTVEFTKALDEKRIRPKATYTDNGVTYVDAVLRGKIIEINTCRKGTRNLSLLVTGYWFGTGLNRCPSFTGYSLSGARGHRTSTGGGFPTPPVARLFVAAPAIMVTLIWGFLRSITAWLYGGGVCTPEGRAWESPSAEGYSSLPSTCRSALLLNFALSEQAVPRACGTQASFPLGEFFLPTFLPPRRIPRCVDCGVSGRSVATPGAAPSRRRSVKVSRLARGKGGGGGGAGL